LLQFISVLDGKMKKETIKQYRDRGIAVSNKMIEKIKRKIIPTKFVLVVENDFTKIWVVDLEENDWLYQKNGGLNVPELNSKK